MENGSTYDEKNDGNDDISDADEEFNTTELFDVIEYSVMEFSRKLLMIPTTDEVVDAALTAINYPDIKHQGKRSVSNTRKLKYLKERWLCKEDAIGRGIKESTKKRNIHWLLGAII